MRATKGAAVSVSVHPFPLALASPFRIAYDTITRMDNALVRASDGAGVAFGEAAPIATVTGETSEGARGRLAAWVRAGAGPGLASLDGSPAARAAADGALCDLASRDDGRPLASWLSGKDRRGATVPSSVTVPLVEDHELEARVRACLGAGFARLKVKAGLNVDRDLARLTVVREIVGERVELRVDANQGWTLADAKWALPRLRDLGVSVLEQPLPRADLAGHAELRRRREVPVMLDESVFTPAEARRAISAGAADVINIKLQKCGGPRQAMEIASIAREAGVPCMVGCMIESRVGILTGAHVVAAHDNITMADLDGATFLAEDPVVGGAVIEEGAFTIGPEPGIGVTDVRGLESEIART